MPDILIVGAGACGLLTAVKLQQAGYPDVQLLEQADRLGGTWRDNVYPGLTCDVPSYVYEFSFAPNQRWSRVYAAQPEILDYLRDVAERFALNIRYGAKVVSARWGNSRWQVRLESGEELSCRFLFLAPGGLTRPHIPELPPFAGDCFHAARWPQDYDFRAKSVGVVGSAASAVQLLPHVARQARRVRLFQRTANWVFPKQDRPYSRLERTFPRLARRWLAWRQDRSFAIFRDHSWLARLGERWALARMASVIRDPARRRALTPDYPLGCKRILLSNDFYPTLALPHVELVTTGVDLDGLDTLILATGYEVYSWDLEVWGRSGLRLWHDGPAAYQGATVAGFPNLFLLLGPNSALGHNSVWLMAEAQADFAVRALRELARRGGCVVEVRRSAMDAYNRALPGRFQGLVWAAGCRSWYKTGDGQIFTLYPGDVASYRRELAQGWEAYEFS